jgi:hypothetical protein
MITFYMELRRLLYALLAAGNMPVQHSTKFPKSGSLVPPGSVYTDLGFVHSFEGMFLEAAERHSLEEVKLAVDSYWEQLCEGVDRGDTLSSIQLKNVQNGRNILQLIVRPAAPSPFRTADAKFSSPKKARTAKDHGTKASASSATGAAVPGAKAARPAAVCHDHNSASGCQRMVCKFPHVIPLLRPGAQRARVHEAVSPSRTWVGGRVLRSGSTPLTNRDGPRVERRTARSE